MLVNARHIVLVITLFISLNGRSQESVIQAVSNGADYPFWLALPEDTILNNKPPILIFLHGRSLSGTNLNLVKKYGVIDAIERGREVPAIVIAPQVKMGNGWEPEKILSTLQYVQRKYDTDSNRVYVCGMSLGGYGTMYFAGAYPDIVAGAVALCGGGKESDACDLSKTNLWIQHGKKDVAVPFKESLNMYNAIIKCDPDAHCEFTSYPDKGHSALAKEFYRDELYDWLFDQQLQNKEKDFSQELKDE